MDKAKFSATSFNKVGDDPTNGEHYVRHSDGARILVWYDTSTRLWGIYAIDGKGHQIGDSEYVVRSDVAWAINNVPYRWFESDLV